MTFLVYPKKMQSLQGNTHSQSQPESHATRPIGAGLILTDNTQDMRLPELLAFARVWRGVLASLLCLRICRVYQATLHIADGAVLLRSLGSLLAAMDCTSLATLLALLCNLLYMAQLVRSDAISGLYWRKSYVRACTRAIRDGVTTYQGRSLYSSDVPQDVLTLTHTPHAHKTHQLRARTDPGGRIKIFSWNCAGLGQVHDELLHWVTARGYDIVILQETLWKFSNTWVNENYVFVHSGWNKKGKSDCGLLVLYFEKAGP